MASKLITKTVRNPLRAALLTGVTALAFTSVSGVAMAGPTYNLYASLNPGANIGSGVQGTVTLSQNGANEVDVTVALPTGSLFVNTGGKHTPFSFNLDTSNANVINITPAANSTTLGFSYTAGVGGENTPYGSFNYAISYNGRKGGGNGIAGPLNFTVRDSAGITVNDFVENTTGYIFAADILGTAGNTGAVGASSIDTPEPGSLALLGTGLLGVGLVVRRRRRRRG